MLGTFYGTANINEALTLPGKLTVTQERIDVSTNLPKLDCNWTFVDSAGHFHAVSGGELPTLRHVLEHRECDGSCGGVCDGAGYHASVYFCTLCEERITPGTRPGPHFDSMPGRYDWQAQLEGFPVGALPRHGEVVSFRFDARDPASRTFFGPAGIGDLTITSSPGGPPLVALTLYPAGELGDRPLVKAKDPAASAP